VARTWKFLGLLSTPGSASGPDLSNLTAATPRRQIGMWLVASRLVAKSLAGTHDTFHQPNAESSNVLQLVLPCNGFLTTCSLHTDHFWSILFPLGREQGSCHVEMPRQRARGPRPWPRPLSITTLFVTLSLCHGSWMAKVEQPHAVLRGCLSVSWSVAVLILPHNRSR